MAMIIQLDRVADSAQDDDSADGARQREAAEVILFPGVRYERWSDEARRSVATSDIVGDSAQAPSRRDWLDI